MSLLKYGYQDDVEVNASRRHDEAESGVCECSTLGWVKQG
jgi:hypothetical protein